jgi:phenylalanyl-tRNA synthetase alpha chain
MALLEFVRQLDELVADAVQAFAAAETAEQLEAARIEFLGAKAGRLKGIQKHLATVPVPDKPAAGKRLNEVKSAIDEAFQASAQRLENVVTELADDRFDPTLPGPPWAVGKIHPITQTILLLKDIMGRLGFTPVEGPEIEDSWHNFDALNVPAVHPARDPLDNFYLASARLWEHDGQQPGGADMLRSQTSTVQIRTMQQRQPPLRIISLGRVYRPDTADETHYPMFHQMEGLMVDTSVTMADLKTVLRLFATAYLGSSVPVRFRPSFFPFTEPSVEVDYFWHGRWVEFGGAGMVDPNVFRAVGYDPERVTGFAFGLGVERLCMIRHGIRDIRDLYTNDVRFLAQF